LSKTKAVLKMFDSNISDYRQYEIPIELDSLRQHKGVLKLGVNKLIKSIESGQIQKPGIDAQALALSLKYGILSKKTAFICVLKEKDDITTSLPKDHVIVPNITSIDYQEKKKPAPMPQPNNWGGGGGSSLLGSYSNHPGSMPMFRSMTQSIQSNPQSCAGLFGNSMSNSNRNSYGMSSQSRGGALISEGSGSANTKMNYNYPAMNSQQMNQSSQLSFSASNSFSGGNANKEKLQELRAKKTRENK